MPMYVETYSERTIRLGTEAMASYLHCMAFVAGNRSREESAALDELNRICGDLECDIALEYARELYGPHQTSQSP